MAETLPSNPRVVSTARRLLLFAVYLVCATALFVVIGCIVYPDWGYAFAWRGGARYGSNYLAVFHEAARAPVRAAL